MTNEYINNLAVPNNTWHVSDPFYKIRIDSIQGDGIIYEPVVSWTPSVAGEAFNGAVGPKKNTSAGITFTDTITITEEGYYYFEFNIIKRPQCTGNLLFKLDTVSPPVEIILEESGKLNWDQSQVVRIPIQYLTPGTKYLSLYLPTHCYVSTFKMMPLKRYEGGRDFTGESEYRLDIIDFKFTQNGITELDMLELNIAMKEDYYKGENAYSNLCFDLGDMVTLWLGEDMDSTIPMFGGYVAGYEISDDNRVLKLSIIDRLWDLSRNTIIKNFSIGGIPKDNEGKPITSYTNFPSVNEVARFLVNYEYGIDTNGIVKDYVIYNDFSESTDVSNIPVSGYEAVWDTTFGHPAPSMRITPKLIGDNSLTLYSSALYEWDAAVHNNMNIDYYMSGNGTKSPVKFNIEIDMTSDSTVTPTTYTIAFNGTSAVNTIGTVVPKYDGKWNNIKVDLNALFSSKQPGTNYYITAVRIVGKTTSQEVLDNKMGSLYIDHFMAYDDTIAAPKYVSGGTGTAFSELQELCDKTYHAAYVRPGAERRDDQLIILPRLLYTLPVEIVEDDNLLEISGINYKPIEWGIVNDITVRFNYNEKRSGSYYSRNDEIVKRYGRISQYEFNSEINNTLSAQTIARSRLKKAYQYPAFTVRLRGTTLIEPGQYMNFRIPSKRLIGTQELQSIEHSVDCINSIFTTELSFGEPGRKILEYRKLMKYSIRDLQNNKVAQVFNAYGNSEAGLNTSSGAFTNL